MANTMTANARYEQLKANPSPRKFYARDLNRAHRAMITENKINKVSYPEMSLSELEAWKTKLQGINRDDAKAVLQGVEKAIGQREQGEAGKPAVTPAGAAYTLEVNDKQAIFRTAAGSHVGTWDKLSVVTVPDFQELAWKELDRMNKAYTSKRRPVVLVPVCFISGAMGNSVRSYHGSFPASSNGSPVAGKIRLAQSLKRRMQSFYPGHRFIFNFAGGA